MFSAAMRHGNGLKYGRSGRDEEISDVARCSQYVPSVYTRMLELQHECVKACHVARSFRAHKLMKLGANILHPKLIVASSVMRNDYI